MNQVGTAARPAGTAAGACRGRMPPHRPRCASPTPAMHIAPVTVDRIERSTLIASRGAILALEGKPRPNPWMALMVGILAVGLAGSAAGCGGDAARICMATGGSYTGGTCSRSGPDQQAAEKACDARGGVYQGGSGTCELGMGGP